MKTANSISLSHAFYIIYSFSRVNKIQLSDTILRKSGRALRTSIYIRRQQTFRELNLCPAHYYADWIR